MIVFPNAKINLGLDVVERRPDGYHNLETVFYPIPLEDALEVVPFTEAEQAVATTDFTLEVKGIEVAGSPEDNLVVKAYRLLAAEFPMPPVHIYMYKHIPSGAGLGGGSSDAAYMLKLLCNLFELPLTEDELEERAARLGADCAFFVRNRPTFATGIGNIFTPVSLSLKGYYLLLVKPDIFVSTRDAFALVEPKAPLQPLTRLTALPVEAWQEAGVKNDFEHSVFTRHPAIGDIKQRLYEMGALYASMSGSGSSVFGIFREPPFDKLNQEAALHFPESFVWGKWLTV